MCVRLYDFTQCRYSCAVQVQLCSAGTVVQCRYSCAVQVQLCSAGTVVQCRYSCAVQVQLWQMKLGIITLGRAFDFLV